MINVSVQVEVTTVGDGENHTDSFLAVNSNGLPPTQQIMSVGNNTVAIPTNAKGVVGVYPTSGGNRILKGISTDTGVTLNNATGFFYLRFQAGLTSFVVSTTVSGESWTLIWT